MASVGIDDQDPRKDAVVMVRTALAMVYGRRQEWVVETADRMLDLAEELYLDEQDKDASAN